MDQPGHYPHQPQRPLFQAPQLPPPSQLHLPSFSRNNTLPPISQIPTQPGRYPPQSYQHPSLPNGQHPGQSLANQSQLPWPATHRTSSSRDEISPGLRHSDSRSSLRDREPRETPPQPQQDPPVKHEGEDGMPSTSDFVKKLYKMLEDTAFSQVVCWGPHGDCFVVKDMNEFTKTILPRMFKHSNFASFVRQLNKYDFHKVKNTDDNQFGEHSWTFRHPDFHADRRDALENIKRKVPAARKSTNRGANSPTPGASTANVDALQNQLERMVRTQDEMAAHIRSLESNYQNVLTEMVNFQRNMAQQDGLMQNLIQYFLQLENGKVKAEELSSGAAQQAGFVPDPNPFLPAVEAQRMMGNAYPDASELARASLAQMNEISRRAEVAGMTFSNNGAASTSIPPARPPSSASRIMAAAAGLMPMGSEDPNFRPLSRQDALARIEELQRARPASAQGQLGLPPSAEPTGAPTNGPSGYEQDPYSNPMLVNSPLDPSTAASTSASTPSTLASPSVALQYGVPISNNSLSHEGLQVFTVGHLMPKSSIRDDNGNWTFDPNSLNAVVMPTPQGMGCDPPQEGETESQPAVTDPTVSSELLGAAAAAAAAGPSSENPTRPSSSSQTLRVRRSTYVPGWAVPPRVLLVDDDAVSRKLSSKFLQVFGCTTDVAVDGVGAVNKMNLEKYDLVLMDIVMPKLDGVSATSLIRQFDHMTPIISMTSNSKPTEILKYYSSGMNDILPKPFTKDGLLDMLEKHLMHLKVIQTMAKIPRSVGIPPLSDASFDQVLVAQANAMMAGSSVPSSSNAGNTQSMYSLSLPEDDGKINPLAGMGLSDEQYTMILQNIVNGESFMGIGSSLDLNVVDGSKRPLDDATDGRDGKRGRFEVIE